MNRISALFGSMLLLFTAFSASAQNLGADRIQITIQDGRISQSTSETTLDLEIVNNTHVTLRLVDAQLNYGTVGGRPLVLTAAPDTNIRVSSNRTETVTLRVMSQVSGVAPPDWTQPQDIKLAVGADINALNAMTTSLSGDSQLASELLKDINAIRGRLQAPLVRESARVSRLNDHDDWFSMAHLNQVQAPAAEAFCRTLAGDIRNAGNGYSRMETFLVVQRRLARYDLNESCLGESSLLLAAQATVDAQRFSTALSMVPRDDNGDVLDAWRGIYIDAQLGQVEKATSSEQFVEVRAGLQSLGSLYQEIPRDRRLLRLRQGILSAAITRVQAALAEEREMDAVNLAALMSEHFPGEAQSQQARTLAAAGLAAYGIRMAEEGNPIACATAYQEGAQLFAEEPAWTSQETALLAARSAAFIALFETALDDTQIERADSMLEQSLTEGYLDDQLYEQLSGLMLSAKWGRVVGLVNSGQYVVAFRVARELEEQYSGNTHVLGAQLSETYLNLARAIWESRGWLGAPFAGEEMDVALQSLAYVQDDQSEEVASLESNIRSAQKLFPISLTLIVLILLGWFFTKSTWRMRNRAKTSWKRGNAALDDGDWSTAADCLESAFDLLRNDNDAANRVGENTTGDMVILIARAYQKQGSQADVETWKREWDLLDEWDRPDNTEFSRAVTE